MSNENITLYSYYRSSCSYRVRAALNLKKLDFVYNPVHLVNDGGEQKKEAYTQMNPMKQVPFFIHNHLQLSQSMAIIQYIDDTWPNPSLFSDQADQKAQQVALCEIINSGIQPVQNLSVMKQLEQNFSATKPQQAAWSKHWIEAGFNALEFELKKTAGLYSFGDQITAVDLFLAPQVYNANRFSVDMDNYPTLQAVNIRCLEHSSFIKSHPDNQVDRPQERPSK